MTAPAANRAQDAPLSIRAQRFAVWLGEGGEPPTAGEESPPYVFRGCQRSAGGRVLDTASFEVAGETVLQSVGVPINFRRAVEIRVPSENSEAAEAGVSDTLLFSGEMGICAVDTSDQERLTAQARVEQWHFGRPVVGWLCKSLDGTDVVLRTIEEDVVFNPVIDGQPLANRSDWYETIDDGAGTTYAPGEEPKWYTWVDPESVRTSEAQGVLEQTASDWTLAEAVLALCYLVNQDETYILNPDFAELNATMADAPALREWRIRRGIHLPAALDDILEPHGFSWFVRHAIQTVEPTDPEEDRTEKATRRIVVFRRGAGPAKTVTLQADGEDRDTLNSNVAKHSTQFNIADVANEVRVDGSFLEVEGTFELRRGWAEADDELSLEELAKRGGDSLYESKPDVWRKWVLCEAGDYVDTRTSITEAFDLNAIEIHDGIHPLGELNVTRRRRFWPPLTLDNDGGRREYLVEYFVPSAAYGEPGEWRDVLTTPNSTFVVLERECGILFTGHTPPDELHARGYNDLSGARVRITACLRADQRLSHTATRSALSPNGNDVPLVVLAEDRFHKRVRLVDGDHRSRYADLLGAQSDADETDDTTKIQAYAEKLRDQEQAARVSPVVRLEGFHSEYEIGDLITKIAGREIDFNENSPEGATTRFPQITSIEYTADATILTLQTFDEVAT